MVVSFSLSRPAMKLARNLLNNRVSLGLKDRLHDGRRVSSAASTKTEHVSVEPRWRPMCGLCLVRRPVITAEKTEIETEYEAMLQKKEFENSLLSDHEMRRQSEEKKGAIKTKGAQREVIVNFAKDLEIEWEVEYKAFTSYPKITDADKENDLKSIHRCYDRSLYFIVQQLVNNNPVWSLPKIPLQEGLSLRETAESILSELSQSSDLEMALYGNAPNGFVKYHFPAGADPEYDGAKVFYYMARWSSGSKLKLDTSKVKDYLWLTKDEIAQYLHPKELSSFQKFAVEL